MSEGLLDLYEASGKEEYAAWAIRLQEKQDELFYDKECGGYFASAPDPHILVRMKDAQVCTEFSFCRSTAHMISGRCRAQRRLDHPIQFTSSRPSG